MSVVLATAGFDHRIRFWEAPSGVCSKMIKFPDSQVNKLEITPDKQFIAAAGNPVIRLYEIASSSKTTPDQVQQPVLTLEGHTNNVTAVGFQKDGRYLFSGSEDGTIKVWDLRNPHYSRSFDSGSAVNSVCLRVDRDELISGDQNGYVKVWDLGGNGCLNSVRPSAGSTSASTPKETSSAASSSSRQATSKRSGNDNDQRVVPIQAVDISEDSRTLVAISNHGTVYVWDPSRRSLPVPTGDDGHGDDDVDLVDLDHGGNVLQPITKFRAHAPGYYCLHGKIAPDCRHLVTTGSDGTAKLWDTTTWELTETLENDKWVWDAAFCADSSYLVTASSDHVARLWNLRTGDVVRKYHGHQSSVTCVALNDSSV